MEKEGSVMNFINDVFISYAHIDNLPLLPEKEGWISYFHQAIEIRVAQLLGARPKFWRDPKLEGNDIFAVTLVDKLRDVALLVSVLSPSYINSEWCRKELHEFVRMNIENGNLTVGSKSRIFKVVKTPVPREKLPGEVQSLLGYEFYKIDPETGRAIELNGIFGKDAQVNFWIKVDDLAHDIVKILNLTSKPDGTDCSQAKADDSVSPAIFLSETTADLHDARDSVKRELQRAGYAVLPDEPFPLASPDFESFTERQLARCRVAIHLVGNRYGLVPEGARQSVIELQNELAADREASGLERLIWIAPGSSASDERQAQILAKLRSGKGITKNCDVYEIPLEEFKSAVQHRLIKIEQSENAEELTVSSSRAKAHIYLICDKLDQHEVIPVVNALFDNGYEVTLPLFAGDETEVREEHEENLRQCDAAMIYYGAGSELWLRSKKRDLARIVGSGRTAPIRVAAIFIAGQETPHKIKFRTNDALLMKGFGQFSIKMLDPFLDFLKSSRPSEGGDK